MIQSAPLKIAASVAQELGGESILWAASPDRLSYANRYWKTALFGIPFAAFAIFWTIQASHASANSGPGFALFFPLWGCMFVVAGLAMLLSPFWAAWVAGGVYYVVTERRAVIFERRLKLTIQSFPPSSVAAFERISSGGAGGNIVFQRISTGTGRSAKVKEIGFIGLRDYSAAEHALSKLIGRNAA